MAIAENAKGAGTVGFNILGDVYIYHWTMETNGAAAPDGVSPAGTITMGYTSEGKWTATFAARHKPRVVYGALVLFEEPALPQYRVVATGYTQSTGVLTFEIYLEDQTSGVQALTNLSNNHTLKVFVFANRSEIGG